MVTPSGSGSSRRVPSEHKPLEPPRIVGKVLIPLQDIPAEDKVEDIARRSLYASFAPSKNTIEEIRQGRSASRMQMKRGRSSSPTPLLEERKATLPQRLVSASRSEEKTEEKRPSSASFSRFSRSSSPARQSLDKSQESLTLIDTRAISPGRAKGNIEKIAQVFRHALSFRFPTKSLQILIQLKEQSDAWAEIARDTNVPADLRREAVNISESLITTLDNVLVEVRAYKVSQENTDLLKAFFKNLISLSPKDGDLYLTEAVRKCFQFLKEVEYKKAFSLVDWELVLNLANHWCREIDDSISRTAVLLDVSAIKSWLILVSCKAFCYDTLAAYIAMKKLRDVVENKDQADVSRFIDELINTYLTDERTYTFNINIVKKRNLIEKLEELKNYNMERSELIAKTAACINTMEDAGIQLENDLFLRKDPSFTTEDMEALSRAENIDDFYEAYLNAETIPGEEQFRKFFSGRT